MPTRSALRNDCPRRLRARLSGRWTTDAIPSSRAGRLAAAVAVQLSRRCLTDAMPSSRAEP
ncbi:hypothetical protein ACIHFB_20915, partial [Streptomyces sp. NPDC051963]|uniref:hypothetical protein n=1 Tax=Streptomyces sp. NPDC051963 TaxID=3365678 RepID=UPI0037D92005